MIANNILTFNCPSNNIYWYSLRYYNKIRLFESQTFKMPKTCQSPENIKMWDNTNIPTRNNCDKNNTYT